jgi:hypothetical protein
MRGRDVNVVALALAGQAFAALVSITGVDPVATAGLMIALDAVAIVGLTQLNTRGARIAAWAHGAAALVTLGAVLAFGSGGQVWLWAATVVGAIRTVGYGIAGRMWPVAAAFGVALAIATVLAGGALVEPGRMAALVQITSCGACLVLVLRARPGAEIVRSSLPGLRFTAIVLVCDSTVGLLSQQISWPREWQIAVTLGVLVALGCAAAAGAVRAMIGELPRWAIVGCVAVIVAAVGGGYGFAWVAHVLVAHESVPRFRGAVDWLDRTLIVQSLGYGVIGAAILVRGTRIPAAPLVKLRWLLAAFAIASVLGIVVQWRRSVVLHDGAMPEGLQTMNLLIELALMGASLAFWGLVAAFRRAIESCGLPAERQVSPLA